MTNDITRRRALKSLATAIGGTMAYQAIPRQAQAGKKVREWQQSIKKGLDWIGFLPAQSSQPWSQNLHPRGRRRQRRRRANCNKRRRRTKCNQRPWIRPPIIPQPYALAQRENGVRRQRRDGEKRSSLGICFAHVVHFVHEAQTGRL